LSLIASDNTATIALVKSTGLNEEKFVEEMNRKAVVLGLSNTNFVDPVGLSDKNISTALDVAKLAKEALANDKIQEATICKNYIFQTKQGRIVKIESTDLLLKNLPPNGLTIEGGKTGYTESAGYCFVGKFKDKSGKEVIAAVLNSANYQTRFSEAKSIAEWVFDSYSWE
jgi:D-alanyl-D-alanine carboxypeptidase